MTTPPDTSHLKNRAYIGPFVIFMALLAIPDLMKACGIQIADHDASAWWTRTPVWLYSLQTVVCAAALIFWRRQYQFRPFTGLPLAVGLGVLGIAMWIVPGYVFRTMNLPEGWYRFLGFTSRIDGFDPTEIQHHNQLAYFGFMTMRFCRLVVVVPLVEEIFWRGFLMRITTDPDGDYWQVPFGTHHRRSLLVVTAAFVLAHAPVDYAAATIYGLLTYWLAVKTKSLAACVVMHAVANLLLGVYVVATQQWGYW